MTPRYFASTACAKGTAGTALYSVFLNSCKGESIPCGGDIYSIFRDPTTSLTACSLPQQINTPGLVRGLDSRGGAVLPLAWTALRTGGVFIKN